MKVGIFTNNYLPNPYGVACSVESFREQFEKLGHQVFIFAPKWKGYADKNPNACPPENFSGKNFGRVFRYPSIDIEIKFHFPLAVPYSRKMDKIIAGLDLDIIHSQHPNLLGMAAMKWAKKKKIPLIFTWHTLYDQYTDFVPFLPSKFSAGWMMRKAVKYANKCEVVVTPTDSVQVIIKNWGVTNKNIISIPTGVEEHLFENPDKNKIRQKYNISAEEIVLFLNCRLTAEKNVEFLFRAVMPILKENKNAKLLIIGDGYLAPKLKAMAEREKTGEQVIFAGVIPKTEVKNYGAAADVFVYASKSETQGMVITEAMYMGLPVVAVDASGIKDLVMNNVSGLLVEEGEENFAEAIMKLINDKDLRKQLGENAAKIAREKYTDKICAEKLMKVYERAIENNKNQLL